MDIRSFWPKRRIPFGFTGDWGKLYKLFTDDDDITIDGQTITYEKNHYVDLGVDIQFKKDSEITTETEQQIKGLHNTVYFVTVSTSDAYYDEDLMQYCCCVEVGDIVVLWGRKWIVTSVQERSKVVPKRMSVWACDVRSIK